MTTTTSRPEPPRPEQGTLLEPADPAAAPGRGENPSRHAVVERDTSDQARADASTRSPHDPSRAAGETRRRVCAWCTQPIPARARRDAICCSVRCRQARHRFGRTVGRARAVAGGHPRLRLAYADPPYPGKAWLYKDHPDYGGEVDHATLIRRRIHQHHRAVAPGPGRHVAPGPTRRTRRQTRRLRRQEPFHDRSPGLVRPRRCPIGHGGTTGAVPTLRQAGVAASPRHRQTLPQNLRRESPRPQDHIHIGRCRMTILADAASHQARANTSPQVLHDATRPTSGATGRIDASHPPADTTAPAEPRKD